MKLALAITWSFCLTADVVSAGLGRDPSWVLVFCPLIILVMKYWMEFFEGL